MKTPQQKPQQNEKVVEFEMSAVKMRQFNKQPIIENSLKLSEDGKWVVHKTVITDIKPVSYFEKVLAKA